ncbi:protein Hook homolog 1-like isoform X2 [Paramacrobiotus metropolitanus]|uniref:protein Hook homolog 1-like isoform X2 n=1 Tax=Paramacrobiotus metropolitanus TaxID=2943436 RepID=UPI0024464904|nr:protein Hook homolog 1-like isoform X2 [Paramacrobiotus metropolitanus]
MSEVDGNILRLDMEEDGAQLFRWFQTLALQKQCESVEDLLDGEAFVEMLESVDSEFFSSISVPASMEDKLFFLRDLEDRMLEYISDKRQNRKSSLLPDESVKRITEDIEEGGISALTRILQLVLVCTVVCPDKEQYINDMRTLNPEVALVISKAIMEIMPVENAGDTLVTPEPVDSKVDVLDWCEKCGSLRSEVNQLNDERKKLLMLNARLKNELDLASDVENERSPGYKKISTLTNENRILQETVTKLETARDEYRARCDELQDQLATAIVDGEQSKRRTAEADKLRDELEEWKQTANSLSKFEQEAKMYRRKMDEIGDIRERLKSTESRNNELAKKNSDLEQEISRVLVMVAASDQRNKDMDDQQQNVKLTQKRLQAAQQEIQDLQDQILQLDRRNKLLESEKGMTRQDSESGFVPLHDSLSFEMESSYSREKLQAENSQLRNELDLLKQQRVEQNALEKSGIKIDGPDTELEIKPNGKMLNGVKDDELSEHNIYSLRQQDDIQQGAEGGNEEFDKILAQRDEHIRTLEREVDFLRRHYSRQQEMMTAAWYQRELKLAQQGSYTCLFGTSADDRSKPSTFLDTQRNAVGPPVNPSTRAQNSVASAYRISSPRGSSRSLRQ